MRLEACVIGGAGVPQIDGDAFDLNGWTAAELSDTEDGIRLMCVDCSLERINGSFKFGQDFAFDDICACDRIVSERGRPPGGLMVSPPNGVKPVTRIFASVDSFSVIILFII